VLSRKIWYQWTLMDDICLQYLYLLLLLVILKPVVLFSFYHLLKIHQHIIQPKPRSSVERHLPSCNTEIGFQMVVFCIGYLSYWCGKMPWQSQLKKGRSYFTSVVSGLQSIMAASPVAGSEDSLSHYFHSQQAMGLSACLLLSMYYGTPKQCSPHSECLFLSRRT
jgi:amino acid permease